MGKVALIVIYNHQYNKNIDILEEIYKDRFTNIYHLVPFYNGEKENVIPVYDNSFYFQGYVAQGFKHYFNEEFDHYFFVADDMVINPKINETNYTTHLQLGPNSCFLPEFISLHEARTWPRVGEAYRWNIKIKGVEVSGQIPSYQEALKKLNGFGLEIEPLDFKSVNYIPNTINKWLFFFRTSTLSDSTSLLFRYLFSKFQKKKYSLSYPIVGSYSDIFVVSSDAIKQFCHYCGVFAATELFVEIGLPTAMMLAAKEIKTEKNLNFQGKALWTKKEYQELDKYNYSLENLIENFPENYLYLHPIKLSKWNKK